MRRFFTLTILGALSLGAVRADVIISAPILTAALGASGAFDVLVSNTGSSAVAVGAFSFDIFTSSSAVDFTYASTIKTTAPYIFAGNSFAAINGFPLATQTGQELTASDIPNDAIQSFINAGVTLSLGEVFYTIAPSATFASVDIVFRSSGTSLADEYGTPVPFTTVNGQITLSPEPRQTIPVLVFLGLSALLAFRRAIALKPNRRA